MENVKKPSQLDIFPFKDLITLKCLTSKLFSVVCQVNRAHARPTSSGNNCGSVRPIWKQIDIVFCVVQFWLDFLFPARKTKTQIYDLWQVGGKSSGVVLSERFIEGVCWSFWDSNDSSLYIYLCTKRSANENEPETSEFYRNQNVCFPQTWRWHLFLFLKCWRSWMFWKRRHSRTGRCSNESDCCVQKSRLITLHWSEQLDQKAKDRLMLDPKRRFSFWLRGMTWRPLATTGRNPCVTRECTFCVASHQIPKSAAILFSPNGGLSYFARVYLSAALIKSDLIPAAQSP